MKKINPSLPEIDSAVCNGLNNSQEAEQFLQTNVDEQNNCKEFEKEIKEFTDITKNALEKDKRCQKGYPGISFDKLMSEYQNSVEPMIEFQKEAKAGIQNTQKKLLEGNDRIIY